VLQILNRENAPYVVVGGFAAAMHGQKREIADLDLVIDPSPTEAQRCIQALTLAGFMPSVPLPLQLLTVVRLFDSSSREVDVFVRFVIPFAELWSRAECVQVADQTTTRLAALADLLKASHAYDHSRPDDASEMEELARRPE
jgi:hypothetical protein